MSNFYCFLKKPNNNISPLLPFYENASSFIHLILLDTKEPNSPSTSQNTSYVFVIVDASCHLSLHVQPHNVLRNMFFKLTSIIDY